MCRRSETSGTFKLGDMWALVCCLNGIRFYPYTVSPAVLAPDLGSQGHLWSENDAVMPWFRLISTSDHFTHPYLTYKKCLSRWYAVSRQYGCTFILLPWPSWPQIWEDKVTWGVKMMPCNVMVEADIHLRPLHTSIFDIYKLFEPILCCLKGIWLHPYRYTWKVGPRFGKSGSLVEWKWCHNAMVEADIHLRLLHTSIFDIHKVFEPLLCCLKAIWLYPHILTLAKLAPDQGSQGHLRRKMMP